MTRKKHPGSGRAADPKAHEQAPSGGGRARQSRTEPPARARPEAVYGAFAVAAPAGAGLTVAAGFLILRVGRTATGAPGGISGGAAAGAAILILVAAVLFGAIAGGVYKILEKDPDPSPDRASAVAGLAAAIGAALCTLLASASGNIDATPGLGFVALSYATFIGLLCGQGAYLGVRRLF